MFRGCPAPASPCSTWEFPVWASWWEAELLPIMEVKPGVAFPAAFAVKAHLGLASQGHCLGLEPEEAERLAVGIVTSVSKGCGGSDAKEGTCGPGPASSQATASPSTLAGFLCVIWTDSSCQAFLCSSCFPSLLPQAAEHFCDELMSFQKIPLC